MINMTLNRSWFLQLGLYDEGMNVWGGEQIELSLRQKPTTPNTGGIPTTRGFQSNVVYLC
jgi:hypothetical protein